MTKTLTGPEFVPNGEVKNVVIMLHGLGSNGDDLMGIVPMLKTELPHTAFLSPNCALGIANGDDAGFSMV